MEELSDKSDKLIYSTKNLTEDSEASEGTLALDEYIKVDEEKRKNKENFMQEITEP